MLVVFSAVWTPPVLDSALQNVCGLLVHVLGEVPQRCQPHVVTLEMLPVDKVIHVGRKHASH